MKKRSFRLILFVVAIAMCGCEEFDPWADVDHGPFPALPEMPEKVNDNNVEGGEWKRRRSSSPKHSMRGYSNDNSAPYS